MNKQLKSKQKHKILNVKNHKIFNYSKLTIVHEWLLKQRMAQKVECLVIKLQRFLNLRYWSMGGGT